MEIAKLVFIFSLLSIISCQLQVCRPEACGATGTYCCSANKCAISEDLCDPKRSYCSLNCRNGCCVDIDAFNKRCGTDSECQSVPIFSLIIGFGSLIVFLAIVALFKIARNRRLAQLRTVPLRGYGREALGQIPTGTVVNGRGGFNPPIKEAEVQPFQQQEISTNFIPMAQPYRIKHQPQQINYDEVEYAFEPNADDLNVKN